MSDITQAKKIILKAKTILISGHINPDGDSVGSLLSLGLALKKIGKTVHMISADGVPARYIKLKGIKQIIKKFNAPVDLAIAVDCSNKEILGDNFLAFKKATTILAIDHHEFRRPFEDIKLIDRNAASVGEMIYCLLENLNIKITRDIAQNLLTSIIVETDSFRLPNVNNTTFAICSKLLELGINFNNLVDMIFWSKRKESVILSGICLSRCKFINKNRLVWSIVKQNDFNLVKGTDADVDSVADEMRSIKDVSIAVLFREKENDTLRVSLRSKGRINVAYIAEQYGGGGHFDVAGCTIANNSKAIKELLTMANKLIK